MGCLADMSSIGRRQRRPHGRGGERCFSHCPAHGFVSFVTHQTQSWLTDSQYDRPDRTKSEKRLQTSNPSLLQMMTTVLLNGALGLITIITYCFAIQSVEEQVIMSAAPYPFVEIFAAATASTPTAIGMTIPIVLMTLAMCINATAAASRQAWSFARDNGLPFPTWFTKLVRMNGNSTPLPLNAMLTSLVILVVVALLNFGGSEVFNSIIGLMTGAVGLTYALSIGCVLWRRLYGEPLPPARWSLSSA